MNEWVKHACDTCRLNSTETDYMAINALPWASLARYVKLRVAHAPGIPGTLSPPPRVSDPDMHHGTCVTRVTWCMPGSLTSCFLWSRWQRKQSQHSRRMSNPQLYVSGKRPIGPREFPVTACENANSTSSNCLFVLTHLDRMTHICVTKQGHDWLR